MNTKTIKFDLNKYKLYEKIKAKQGDTKSRFLLFQLLDGSIPFNLTNRSVRAYMVKPDGKEIFNDLIINNYSLGYCTLELTNQVLAVSGTVKIELMVTEEDKKLTSSVFELEVVKSINSEKSIVSTNEFTALLNGLASLSEYDNYKNSVKSMEINKADKAKVEEKFGEVYEQLEHIETQNKDINLFTQAPLPAKQGISTNSYKLALKNNSKNLKIVQKANLGYIMHTFINGEGDTSSSSVGGSWGLLRLRASEMIANCFLWKEPIPKEGVLTKSIVASDFNSIEGSLVVPQTANNVTNNVGLALYDIEVGESFEFEMTATSNDNANIFYLSNTNRSRNVDICINGIIVKNIDTNKGYVDGYYVTEDFKVPTSVTSYPKYTIKITNNGDKKFSFCCFNFKKLEEFNGEYIDSYKIYRIKKYFIDNIGASDYAISDKDLGKWCGSYHGGETSEMCKISWNKLKLGLDYREVIENFNDILDNTFTIVKDLKIIQQTNINNKAKMTSIFDFNIDGTLNMNFGLNNNTIKASNIYTSLTCTSPDFKSISYPEIKGISVNDNTNIKVQNGYVEQSTDDLTRKLGIRFTMYNNFYNTLGVYILNNTNYSKLYYGAIAGYNDGVIIPNLTFSKALDFYNLSL